MSPVEINSDEELPLSWRSHIFNTGEIFLSYDVAPGSDITACNKIDKPLMVYRFSGNVMTSITTLRTYDKIIRVFRHK